MVRKDILERKNEILNWIQNNQSKAFIGRELNCKPSTLNNYLKEMNIEYKGNQGGKGIKNDPKRKTAIEYINSDSIISTYRLKLKLFEDKIKEEKCEKCGNDKWLEDKIPLELHHIDGNRYNNEINNLMILCPNCHTLEPNNSGAANKKIPL
jgi:Zn finger protein HypA/HybF involved in hydrogenase expression